MDPTSGAWKDNPWTLSPPTKEPKRTRSKVGTVAYWKTSIRRLSVFADIDLRSERSKECNYGLAKFYIWSDSSFSCMCLLGL